MHDGAAPVPLGLHSILFIEPLGVARDEARIAPDCFRDLRLDRVVAAITAGWKDYDLEPFFYLPLTSIDEIRYRQEVLHDLEGEGLLQAVRAFANGMRTVRDHLQASSNSYYEMERQRWLLDAVTVYCDAVEGLQHDLQQLPLTSRGMLRFRDSLAQYAATASFVALATQARELTRDLSAIRYCVLIQGDRITVRNHMGEADYRDVIEQVFARFRRDSVKDYRLKVIDMPGMNHIDAQVVERVAWLNPEPFQALGAFFAQHRHFLNDQLALFEREVHFYVAVLEQVAKFRRAGLSFCYPRVSADNKEVSGSAVFDIALAEKLTQEGTAVVCNDFYLRGPERVFVVSGPNQGGKTTFARLFGQLHYLARLGCLVPGSEVRVFLCDHLYTHFEREETIENLRGKLQDDLARIRSILDEASPRSILILNEVFSSTSLTDAVFLSKEIMARISALDVLGVWVTFLDELASFNEKTVSVVAAVQPDNPAVRTYKLERRPPDGLTYALAIAEKYRVTYRWLKQRVTR